MIKSILASITMICMFALLIFLSSMMPRERTINCGIAEISPDFTTEMREACRTARTHKL